MRDETVPARGPLQMSLFEAAPTPSLDLHFRSSRRTHIDATSWVDHVPHWLTRHDHLLEDMLKIPSWEQRDRWMFNRRVLEPRMTAEYPILAEAPIEMLHQIGAALSQKYGVNYDGAWLNLYRNETESTSWHADYPSCKRPECIVPVLSLGATRRFQIRPRAGGKSTTFTVEGGDLVVMGGRCQEDWLHCVPKQTTPAGPRVSVNFQSSFQAVRP